MKIVIDTNALVYAAKNKLDIQVALKQKFGLLAIYVPDIVLGELKSIALNESKASDRAAASLAYQIVKQKKLTEIKLTGSTDQAIATWAAENHAAVLTNDLALKWILREKHVPVYHIRQEKYIEEW